MKEHVRNFKKRYELLNKVIEFLLENEFSFSIESDNYTDEDYFNFTNSIRIFDIGDVYLEIDENSEKLFIYEDDYSMRTCRPNEIIKNINEIFKYLKELKKVKG